MSAPITTNGTTVITTFPGDRYVVAISGGFGGGSMAVNWLDADDDATPYNGSPLTTGGTFVIEAASTRLQLVLNGATAPTLEAVVTLAGSVQSGGNSGPLYRTAAQGDPNVPDTLTITGITTPAGINPLVLTRTTDESERPSWAQGESFFVFWNTNVWVIEGEDSLFEVVSSSMTPVGLTAWNSVTGVGNPIVTGSLPPIPAFIGQECIVGGPVTAKRMIYKSNAAGTWDLVGSSPPGVIVKTDGSHWVTAVDANDALTIAPFILS